MKWSFSLEAKDRNGAFLKNVSSGRARNRQRRLLIL
jgi:hypothetical protein